MEITLPAFDTGLYEGSELHMAGGGAVLTVHIAEHPDFSVRFTKVRWHQFTTLPNCTQEMVGSAYFKVVEVESSRELADFLKKDRSSQRAYKELHHFRIFLDETGCHEFLAESANA